MGKGGYQGPEPWEIRDAVEQGMRRASGEYIPPSPGSQFFSARVCCCLVPAIIAFGMLVVGALVPILFEAGVLKP
ncbi:hypothetical protein [Streptomyces albogriseolus]|uniref:hypothetical protein n=1 Tax=Streptomyces albogriseolus TaxID=1887 RepID=UPI0022502AD6|nr:hypothetical protein [Streptomyces viridodiastaticus]MCX4624985.1 hypothetical protein [Streptomyces viridodiastaticus]